MQAAIKAGRRTGHPTWKRTKSRVAGEVVTRGSRGMEFHGFRQNGIVQSMFMSREMRRHRTANTGGAGGSKRLRTGLGPGDISRMVSR